MEKPVTPPVEDPSELYRFVPGLHSQIVETARRSEHLAGLGLVGLGGFICSELLEAPSAVSVPLAVMPVVMWGAAYAKYRVGNQRQLAVNATKTIQEKSNWSQPIDWYEAGIRWYGFDRGYHEVGFDPLSNLSEFKRLAVEAEAAKVASITVSSAIMELLPEKLESYGRLNATEGEGRVHRKVVDLHADESRFIMSPAQALIASRTIESQFVELELKHVMSLIEKSNPGHPALRLYNDNGLDVAPLIAQTVRSSIESRSSSAGVYLDRGPDGTGYQRQLSHSRGILRGDRMDVLSETVLPNGAYDTRFNGQQAISGGLTIPELITKATNEISQGDKRSVETLETATWLLIAAYRNKTQVTHDGAPAIQLSAQERILKELPSRTPYLRRYGQGVIKVEASLKYVNARRVVVAAALAGAGLLATASHYAASSHSSVSSKSEPGVGIDSHIGDVSGNLKKVAWHIAEYGGASASGYWTQDVDNTLVYSGGSGQVPPYKGRDLYFIQSENRGEIRLLQVTGNRLVKHDTHDFQQSIEVSGDISFDDLKTYGTLRGRILKEPYANGFNVPLPLGSMLINAAAKQNDKPLATEIYRNDDGTFSVRLRNGNLQSSSPVHLVYDLVPIEGSKIALPHAQTPIAVFAGGVGDTVPLLNDLISLKDATDIASSLQHPPTDSYPTLVSVTAAVHNSHAYSYTPYKDSHVKLQSVPHDFHTEKELLAIGKMAARIRTANCNVAALQTLLISRGQDDDGMPLNMAVGYHVYRGDVKSIFSGDAHAWVVDRLGKIYDATPSGASERSKNTEITARKLAGWVLGAGILGIVLAGGARETRRYRKQRAHAYLFPDDPSEVAARNHQISQLEWLQYAPIGSTYDSRVIGHRVQLKSSTPLLQRYKNIPRFSPNHFEQLLAGRSNELDNSTSAELRQLVKRLRWLN